MSVDYYVRLERGNLSGASESVLESLASALQLDDAERAHLYHLARATSGSSRRAPAPSTTRVRPTLLRILDAMPGTPAYLRNGRFDILAANHSAELVVRCYEAGVLD
jgi:MmyB-like transcription regulator ligand binding domain